MDSPPNDKWGFGYLIGWFVGCTSCTLQTLYAWLMRGCGIGMVGILIYRVLHLSLRCDSWYAHYVINLVTVCQCIVVTTVYKRNGVSLKPAWEQCNLLTGIKNALCPIVGLPS